MNYFSFHIGDYAAHTQRLSLMEDLAYRRMMDAYYVAERPFNGCSTDVAREIGMMDQLEAVEYVLQISGQEHDATLATAGATVFAENCVACHMENGKGDRTQGAPNLTDAVWLYGGDRDTLTYTIYNARFGVMPSWQARLSEDEIRAVATYVHSLGGGE